MSDEYLPWVGKVTQIGMQILELSTHRFSDRKTLLGTPEERSDFTRNEGFETLSETWLQSGSNASGASIAFKVAFGLVALDDKVAAKKILQAEERDSGPPASSSGTAKVAKHFGTLQKVEIGHGEPSGKETEELRALALEQIKGHTAGVNTVADHFSFVSEKSIKLVPRDQISIARARRIAKN